MLAAGRSNQVIAAELVVTLDTVKKHVSTCRQARRGQSTRPSPGPGNWTKF